VTRVADPPGRQGPGPTPDRAVRTLDLGVARRASGLLPGERRAAGLGEGTELAQLRAYQVGDDVRMLDAAASARTGVPHVKLHVPERTLTTWLVVDVSASMAFGTAERLKSDVAEGAAGVLARLAVRRGGHVALVTAGEPRPRTLPPRSGEGALHAVRTQLAQGVAPDGHADPDGLARALRSVGRLAQHGRALVAVVSDFRDAHELRPPLAALGARHSVLAVEVRDPREGVLPAAGHLALVDPETGERVQVDTTRREVRERVERLERERREALRDDLRAAGAAHVTLTTEGDWLRTLGRSLAGAAPAAPAARAGGGAAG
jgi:uncharacterized protein (DUF58 family)